MAYFDTKSLFGTTPEELQREIFDKSQQRRAQEMQFLAQNTTAPGYTYGMLQSLEPLRQQFANTGEDPRVEQLRQQSQAAQQALSGFQFKSPKDYAEAASRFLEMGMLDQGTKLLKMAEAKQKALSGGIDMTTREKDIRDIAINKYQTNLDDPDLDPQKRAEIYTKADADWLIGKRAGLEETSKMKDINDLSKIVAPDIYEKGAAATNVEANLTNMENLLGEMETGWGREAQLAGENFLESVFGVKTGAPTAEAFRSLAMNQVLGFVQNTKGSISDAEMRAFGEASPALSRTKRGNKLIIKVAKKAATYQRKLFERFNEWRADPANAGKGMSAWGLEAEKFRRNNGFTITQAEIQEALQGPKVGEAQQMETVFTKAAPEYYSEKGTFKGKPAYIVNLPDGKKVMHVITEPEDGSAVMPITR